MVKISAQFEITGVISPQPPTPIKIKIKNWAQFGPEPKKPLLFLLGKVKNNKYPEAETWHPESRDGWVLL